MAPPLAVRNFNPGNLRYVGQSGAAEGERGFARFGSMAEGLDALKAQLRRYYEGKTTGTPLRTVAEIITTWAPPSENDTGAYVARVSDDLGVAPDAPLDLDDPAIVGRLARAIAEHESGLPFDEVMGHAGVSAQVAEAPPAGLMRPSAPQHHGLMSAAPGSDGLLALIEQIQQSRRRRPLPFEGMLA